MVELVSPRRGVEKGRSSAVWTGFDCPLAPQGVGHELGLQRHVVLFDVIRISVAARAPGGNSYRRQKRAEKRWFDYQLDRHCSKTVRRTQCRTAWRATCGYPYSAKKS